MNNTFYHYLSELTVKHIGTDDLCEQKNLLLAEDPVMHIPSWPYLKQDKIEIIVKSFAGIIYCKEGQIVQCFGDKVERLQFKNIYDLLKDIESNDVGRLPFFFGLLAYELSENKSDSSSKADYFHLPDFYLIFPAEALIINCNNNTGSLINSSTTLNLCTDISFLPDNYDNTGITFNESKTDYLKKIERIRQLIFNGEVYQVNYTISLSSILRESGYSFFKKLYKINPAPFSAYIRLPEAEIISNSPERFLLADNDLVLTEPIKGTIRRHSDPVKDKELAERLLNSEKDRAELNMIVDLLRNDISKVCKPGSVIVKSNCCLESFSNVHHLVSTVEGRFKEGADYINLIKAAFPGGSITGCPKSAALKYISEMENRKRSFYTGSLFIKFPLQNQFDSSLLIRTAIAKEGRIYFQVGGGIVIDSEPEAEYDECLAKADSFLKIVKK